MAETQKFRHLWIFDFGADFLAVVAAYYTTFVVRFHYDWGVRFFTFLNRALSVRETGELGQTLQEFYFGSAFRIILIVTTVVTILYGLRDLYPERRFIRNRFVAWNIIVANLFALALFYAYFYLSRNVFHPRSFFAIVILLNILYCILFRALTAKWLRHVRSRSNIDLCRAVLIGEGPEADYIDAFISEFHPHGIRIMARIPFDPEKPFQDLLRRIEHAESEQKPDVVISVDKRLSINQIMELLELAERLDISAKILSDKMEVLVTEGRLPMDMIMGLPLAHFEAPSTKEWFLSLRNISVRIVAGLLLVLLAPVFGVIALLIRLTSSGPVFFQQERIGVNRQAFRMYKFRTMYHRSDEMQAQVEEFNESGQALFKIRKDPRVTRIGRFLRRFSLDELPQLTNVVRGEMTIVGPRPLPRRDFENYYEDWHYGRHGGMPGLTCLWQVSGRSDLDFHNMCILDIYYLRNKSWVLDLKIILRTFWAVLFAKGAY